MQRRGRRATWSLGDRAEYRILAAVGRELHDDIGQRLAMLSVELEQLDQNPSELHSHVPEIRKELRQISDGVQALSHDLHSSKLEYLGAVASMRSWCQEFAERQKMEIDFKSSVSSTPSRELGLALFRVLYPGALTFNEEDSACIQTN